MTDSPIKIQVALPPTGGETYLDAVRRAGGSPVAGYCPAFDPDCHGLLLTGGGDLDPALYHQGSHGSDPPDPDRDQAEMSLCATYLAAQKPILGICRGIQILNVALGGDLIQDLPPQQRVFHTGRGTADNIHLIRAQSGTLLWRWYGDVFTVNSSHHQALGKLGAGLSATAWAESGFAEGVEHRSLPVLGLQFHPERMTGARKRSDTVDGIQPFQWLVAQCKIQL